MKEVQNRNRRSNRSTRQTKSQCKRCDRSYMIALRHCKMTGENFCNSHAICKSEVIRESFITKRRKIQVAQQTYRSQIYLKKVQSTQQTRFI